MLVHDVTDANLAAVQAFLERHAETTLFLASSLASFGPRRGESLNSGNFRCLREREQIIGVFCLSGRGSILVETGGRTDLGATIVDACRADDLPIGGVLGEWRGAESTSQVLEQSFGFHVRYRSRELLYRLELPHLTPDAEELAQVRRLTAQDFAQWRPHYAAYLQEEGLPVQGSPEQQRANFEAAASAQRWWGYWQGGELLATIALNAVHQRMGQVGGVFTSPPFRRRGLSRATLKVMLSDCRRVHGLDKLVLFTGRNNLAACALYESFGFSQFGEFGLFFGAYDAT
ncbi:MAG TPA: GNAT family N-acetyltransferase [Polyangiaceae bacterium]|jgi:RimJ/RimL family protein N-acetyltransferase